MIKFNNINLIYDDKVLFKGYSLNIEENEKILINGPSGCGKTSLFRLLLGFSKIDKGEIHYNNQILNKKNIRKIRSDIFYLSQDIDFRNDSVENIIKEVFEYDLNKHLKYDISQINDYMIELELDENLLSKNIIDLSGGERQRIGLLICFLLNRPTLLLDEPTSALDEKMKNKVADLLLQKGKTVLIISHDEVFQRNKNYKKVELTNGNNRY